MSRPLGLEVPVEEPTPGGTVDSPLPTETPAEPAEPAEPGASPPPQEEPPEEPGAEPGTPPASGTKKGKSAEDRIHELVRQIHTLEGRIEEMSRRSVEPAAPAAPAAPAVEDKPPVKPDPNAEWKDANDYWEARDKWIRDQTLWDMRQERRREQERQQQDTLRQQQADAYAKAVDAHNARVREAAKKDPGLMDIVKSPDLKCSDAMTAAIIASEDGPRLMRWLYDNRDEAERIFAISPTIIDRSGRHVQLPGTGTPYQVAMEMGRIVEKIKSQPDIKPRKQSNAPPPHNPVGGNKGGGGPEDLSDLAKSDPDEYLRRIKAKK